MYSSQAFLLALPLLSILPAASADCYSDGLTIPSSGDLDSQRTWVCNQLIGSYTGHETRSACAMDAIDGFKYDVRARNSKTSNVTLTFDDCKSGTKKVLEKCSKNKKGGDQSFGDYTFWLDPNYGRCLDDSYLVKNQKW